MVELVLVVVCFVKRVERCWKNDEGGSGELNRRLLVSSIFSDNFVSLSLFGIVLILGGCYELS
jgi:hypothetical protein